MSTSQPISTIMTSDPATIDRTQPLSEAYQLLQDAPFHHLVVTDGDEPIGMLATSDILRLVYDVDAADDRALRELIDYQFSIDDAMTAALKTLGTDATIQEAAAMLSTGAFHSVLVLGPGGGLAGIVTTTDLARYLAEGDR